MIALLLRLGLPPGIAKLLPWVIAALALLAALWWLRSDAFRDGERAERGRWEQRIAADKAAQIERERKADASLRFQKAKDAIAADERKAEIDNATRHIPDQGLTARQRARACLSLRAEAKTHGRPIPAC